MEVADDPLALLPATAVVAVAMSGGVDSSVVAARVAATGRRAIGITLAMWASDREVVRDRGCCSVDAVEDARKVAGELGIAHYVWNLERDFHAHVVKEFLDEYASGSTPNPCTRCNERIKFGVLLERARAVGATHLATGHYARVRGTRGRRTLHRACDLRRDQSYVLHRLTQDQLAAAVFPLGAAASKADVREEASALGMHTARKPESQDLCFVEERLSDELRRRLNGRFSPGAVLDETGARIGEHRGLPFLTVGQRSGFTVPPARPDAKPLYVLELHPESNAAIAGPRERLQRTSLVAHDCAWISGSPPTAGSRCSAQLRSHGVAHDAVVERASADRLALRFIRPVEQVSPGQSVVLFDADEVLGGGIIRSAA